MAGVVPILPSGHGDYGATISKLQELCLAQLQAPDIRAMAVAVDHVADFNTNFQDRNAFTVGADKYLEEAAQQGKLNELMKEGQHFAAVLYTWRACSLAIPSIQSNEQLNRLEIYEKTAALLEPEIMKLKKLLQFQRRAIDKFSEDIQHLCREGVEHRSEAYIHMVGGIINMFATVDELKNIKASIKNDFAAFKRASEMLKLNNDPIAIRELQELSYFLATNSAMLSSLKTKLQTIEGFEDFLCEIIQISVRYVEESLIVTPPEKHATVKIIGLCLYLVDSDKVNINKIEGKKKLNLAKIDKIFKRLEVVPLYGDMMISPFKYVQMCPNYDATKWSHCLSETASSESNILTDLTELREQHVRLQTELALQTGCADLLQEVNRKLGKSPVITDGNRRWLSEFSLQTLRILGQWTGRVMEFFCWKMAHPADPEYNKGCPPDSEEYERATRYNYTAEEKFALVEVISMIKSVQKALFKLEPQISEAVSSCIYNDLQDFLQVQLREPLRKASKHKKDGIQRLLLGVMTICVNAANGNVEDPLLKGKKDLNFKVDIPKKSVLPSSTQLYLLRTMLEALISKKNNFRKDLDSKHVETIEKFLKNSFYWTYMINFPNRLNECCDLSQMWYREFYLEMSRGRRLQFPIEMSMPWILTDNVLGFREKSLKKLDPQMLEYILYPLDLYNDSAHCALNVFKKQFLYDEVEAEVNLVFDQLMFKLSEHMFSYYKKLAAGILFDKKLKALCKKSYSINIPFPNTIRYGSIMRQESFWLLGRAIDIKRLITQRMNTFLLKSLDAAISKFESEDLTFIMELDGLIECNRLTHRMLSQHLQLDDFDALLAESNAHVTVPCGRITLHLYYELNFAFFPNYCYNAATDRFVKTTFPFAEPPEREKMSTVSPLLFWGNKTFQDCYGKIYGRFRDFVGTPHFLTIGRLLSYQEIAVVLKQILEFIGNTLQLNLVPYVNALIGVMPKRCKMPRYDYGSAGVLEYYQAQLQDIVSYSDLQPKVFQCFREIGNAILFCLLLEKAMVQREVVDLTEAALFQAIIPKPFVKKMEKKEEMEAEMMRLMKKAEVDHKSQHCALIIGKSGTEEQKAILKDAALLTREKLSSGLSLFQMMLLRIRSYLTDPVWQGPEPPSGYLDATTNLEFHHLWSALQFVFCIPRGENEFSIEQLFGEGLNWAACALIALLGQQRRFEAMDFCYLLVDVHKVDQKDAVVKGVATKRMVERIKKFSLLNDQIFAQLGKHLCTRSGRDAASYDNHVIHQAPPNAPVSTL